MIDNKDRFKFRFFEKKTETLYQVDEIAFGKGKIFIRIGNQFYFIEDGILIQSTGFMDKNGKLIYEGDIIKTPFPHDTYHDYGYYEIIWCNKGFRLYQKCIGLHRKTGDWVEARDIQAEEWDYDSFEYYFHKNIKIEIIGNKFKNPELLKK